MNKTRKILIGACAVLLLSALTLTGIVFAKYINKRSDDVPVYASSFYFESNYLTSDNHNYSIGAGKTGFTLELRNFENALRVSEVDCTYYVTVTTDSNTVTLGGVNTKTADYTVEKKVDPADSDKLVPVTTKVNVGGLENGKSYEISVTAIGGAKNGEGVVTEGYRKTLSATFTVGQETSGVFMHVDSSDPNMVILTVWTKNVNGTASITIPGGLMPLSTDPILSGVHNYYDDKYNSAEFTDSTSFAEEEGSSPSRTYVFIKTADYDENSVFNVTFVDDTDGINEIPIPVTGAIIP